MTLIVKRISSMPLRDLQELMNYVFTLVQLPLSYSHYTRINKRDKTVNVAVKTKIKGTIQH
ncbi:Mobile element protein [Candidatus Enterovibrio altilux]|uniref:Mobile element protein n=1 Tax=Candidatus Enterovibrio altilux TaxID=1927128 RepID=A0A291B8A8_9GAMM|nr:Mobile element protein [Candidatus Enterovibrio luxaltus]